MKKGSSHPYIQLVFGIGLTIIGITLIAKCISYSTPSDYNINAFDAIFLIPAIIKILYYTLAEGLFEFMIPFGTFFSCCGVSCIIFGIRGILKDDYISYFKKGDLPTEAELRSLLEKGELTKEEYNEIMEYKRHKK